MRTRGTISILSDAVICANCKHFHQHYGYDALYGKYFPMHIGHCVYPRLKDRTVSEYCINFEAGERAEYVKMLDNFYEKFPHLRAGA